MLVLSSSSLLLTFLIAAVAPAALLSWGWSQAAGLTHKGEHAVHEGAQLLRLLSIGAGTCCSVGGSRCVFERCSSACRCAASKCCCMRCAPAAACFPLTDIPVLRRLLMRLDCCIAACKLHLTPLVHSAPQACQHHCLLRTPATWTGTCCSRTVGSRHNKTRRCGPSSSFHSYYVFTGPITHLTREPTPENYHIDYDHSLLRKNHNSNASTKGVGKSPSSQLAMEQNEPTMADTAL